MRWMLRAGNPRLGASCLVVLALAACSRGGGGGGAAPRRDATFVLVANMAETRADFTATLLADGRVLFVGGSSSAGAAGTAELFDPVTASFTPPGGLTEPRSYHVASRLADGQVLVAGGAFERNAELFDPVTVNCVATGDPAKSHANGTATAVGGSVYLIGGIDTGTTLADVERYDATTGLFSSGGSLLVPRGSHTSTLLTDGRILVAGGAVGSATLSSAELYDPSTGQSTATPPLQSNRTGHTATRLLDGRVLIAGGATDVGVLFTAELFDPASGAFTSTGSMSEARYAHAAALLCDGRVLIAGGYDFTRLAEHDGILDGAEIWDPATGAFTRAASLNLRRAFVAATSLGDGSVLVAGGIHDWSGQAGYLESVEIYR